jgi:hypothetical protein
LSNDLLDAVIATLELNAGFTTAFGDTWNQAAQTGVAKVFADFSDQVAVPYSIVSEVGESYEYMTSVANSQVSFIATGQLVFDIYAAGRYQTRTLGLTIATALNDDALAWSGGTNMVFRMDRSMFVPVPGQSGPGIPIMFHRVFTFSYVYSGVMP